MRETALYAPVKAHLERLGYACKGEIGGCDLVGLAEGEPPVVVIVELKATFNLELVLQAVDRAKAGDEIWLAARLARKGRHLDRRFRDLCRRLGFGLLGVAEDGRVEAILSPIAPPPRRDAKRRSRLIEEHRRRRGDPQAGGSTRAPIMTAYRQRALLCAHALAEGPKRPRDLRATGAQDAGGILLNNVYGWFAPVSRGVYALTEAGRAALARWPSDPRHAGHEIVDGHVVREPPLPP